MTYGFACMYFYILGGSFKGWQWCNFVVIRIWCWNEWSEKNVSDDAGVSTPNKSTVTYLGKSHNIILRKIKKMLLVVFVWKKQIIKIPTKETKRDEPTDITFQEIQEWEKCSNIKGSKLFKERKIPGFISKGMADISTYVNKNKNR